MCVSRVCVCGGGDRIVQPPRGDLWFLGYGLANCTTADRWADPCASNVGAQNHATYKNQKFRKSREFLHAQSKTRIACWNVRTLASLSNQSAPLLATIDTMKKKRMSS